MSATGLAYTFRRAALTAIAVAAFVTALTATSAAIEGHADAGLVFDAQAETVISVSPTGFAWRDGVRPGQRVVSVSSAEDPGGWQITTLGLSGPIVSREGPIETTLTAYLPFALLAAAAGALAVLLLRTNRDWVLPVACMSLLGSSVPLFLANADTTGATLLLAALVPATGVLWRLRRALIVLVVAAAGVGLILAVWWSTWSSGAPDAETLEQARRAIAVAGTGLLVVDRVLQRAASTSTQAMSRTHLIGDLVAVLAVGRAAGTPLPGGLPGAAHRGDHSARTARRTVSTRLSRPPS